jgi:Rad3-related DNA helicases
MLAVGLQQARGLVPWQELAAACDHAARELRIAAHGEIGDLRGSIKLRWAERRDAPAFVAALARVATACEQAAEALATVSEIAPDFGRLHERALRLAELACQFGDRPRPGQIRWIDLLANQVRLVESPLDIREALGEQMANSSKAWIFTSATLGDDDRLSWFTEPAGLEDARIVRLGSPFDYRANARVFVPRAFPKPSEPGHADAVARLAARCARALGGRTFVLTTTLRSLQTVGAQLRAAFDADGDAIEVLVQGQGSKRQLMQRFLDAEHAVLVGSQSFWEGVDVPGAALQCVVIDKLPFPPPGDPLVEARVQRLESEGRNAFTSTSLPRQRWR